MSAKQVDKFEDVGHWIVLDEEFNTDSFGFVYIITNNINGMKYIGQKMCYKIVKYPPLKGRKNKRHIQKDSDWRTYVGSSDLLKDDIESQGIENFTFEILQSCVCKWDLAYTELKMQMAADVLFDPQYYNGIVHVRIGRAPKKYLEKHGINK